ncbi:hypothetical protein Trydic_g14247 [Trypoxylus dichotomus]
MKEDVGDRMRRELSKKKGRQREIESEADSKTFPFRNDRILKARTERQREREKTLLNIISTFVSADSETGAAHNGGGLTHQFYGEWIEWLLNERTRQKNTLPRLVERQCQRGCGKREEEEEGRIVRDTTDFGHRSSWFRGWKF